MMTAFMTPKYFKTLPLFFACGLMLLGLVNCGIPGLEPAQPTIDATAFFKSALLTATYGVPTATHPPSTATPLPPTATIPPTPTVPRTPPALPPVFTSDQLSALDTPHTYVKDTCQYLKEKWNPNNSAPGTVVMPIMFHSISDSVITDPNQITHGQLVTLLKDLKGQGFESITMQQMADFMLHNAKIPNRSVLLIVDDRRNREYFDTHFVPQLKEYHWTLTNAWISLPDSTSVRALPGNIEIQNEGWVDHQAHGVVHNTNIQNWGPNSYISTSLTNIPAWNDIMNTVAQWPQGTFFDPTHLVNSNLATQDFMHLEIYGSMVLIKKNFGKAPIAYIWPGGGFSAAGAKMAGEAGYLLGFTINPRGPLMYNWVPLTDKADPNRPSYIPEGQVENPLMVLPRYWDSEAAANIDTVRLLGKAAAAAAAQSKTAELDYYDIVCKPTTGELPTPAPQ